MQHPNYRGWSISTVCCAPFAYREHHAAIRTPWGGGVPGLVDAIDRYMRAESIIHCDAILADRAAAIAAGQWDPATSQRLAGFTQEQLEFHAIWRVSSGHPKGWRVTRQFFPPLPNPRFEESEGPSGRLRLFRTRESAARAAALLNAIAE